MSEKASHPYARLPDTSFWGRAVAGVAPEALDPVICVPFRISASDKVATAGSCFAQHIARHLQNVGFNYFVSEAAHPILPAAVAESFGYGMFTARYGNIYTARQLLQLLQRAHGNFVPRDNHWQDDDGRWRDPFRPRIEPEGFASLRELELDRKQHFAAVRRALAELDVFVFTLGLTEAWVSREDGAVYPLCPGTAGGTFDEQRHAFHNFSVSETVADLLASIDFLRNINPAARVILTVSPVPLVATADQRHVLTATTYSKSVLRVAAEEVCLQREQVAYFPSYEIITGGYSRGRYFAQDLRSVTEEGVSHVMRTFLKHFAGVDARAGAVARSAAPVDAHTASMEHLVQVHCDEEVLAAAAQRPN
jgi:hypothetical protein